MPVARFRHAADDRAPTFRRRAASAAGRLLSALLSVTLCLSGGCQSARVADPLTATLGGNDAGDRMEFWYGLGRRPVVSNDEALHALLLYFDDTDPAADYAGRVRVLQARGLLPAGFDRPADAAADRGTVAVALVRGLGIKGGLTMRLTGASPRYAVRAMEARNLYPPSSPNQTFSGAELVGVMGRVEDYQHGNPADAPAALLPGEIAGGAGGAGLVGSTIVTPDGGGGAEGAGDAGAVRPLMLNVLNVSSSAFWWQEATQPANPGTPAPPPPPPPTKDKPAKLKAIITGVEGELAEVRKSEADPWVRAKVGMSAGESAEFRTGPKSAIRFVIPPDHVYTIDRQGTVTLLAAAYDGKTLKTDVGMRQGRVRLDVARIATPVPKPTTPDGRPDEPGYRIEEAGVEHDSTIRSPNTALAIRGTLVSLVDEPPFTPEAVSLTGRAVFRNTRRQLVAFGGTGAGKTAVRGDQASAAEQSFATATALPDAQVASTDFQTQETALVLNRGGFIRGDVLVGNSSATNAELADPGRGLLPGFLNFVLRWTDAPTPGLNDLNLAVFSPVNANATGGFDFVANPPFTLSLEPTDPTAQRLRANSSQIAAQDPDSPASTGFYPKASRTGGRIGRNHVGPQGLEIASWPRNYPVGTYQVRVYNLVDAFPPPATTDKPVNYTVDVFLGGARLAGTQTLSVGQLQTSDAILVRVPAPPAAGPTPTALRLGGPQPTGPANTAGATAAEVITVAPAVAASVKPPAGDKGAAARAIHAARPRAGVARSPGRVR